MLELFPLEFCESIAFAFLLNVAHFTQSLESFLEQIFRRILKWKDKTCEIICFYKLPESADRGNFMSLKYFILPHPTDCLTKLNKGGARCVFVR